MMNVDKGKGKGEEDLSGFWERQSRQVVLSEIGVEGALNIRRGKVLVIGLGGLGVPIVSYLAACGMGQLGLVDGDTIDLSNLGRQFAYYESEITKDKVSTMTAKIKSMNSEVEVVAYNQYFDQAALLNTIEEYDVVVDAVDRLQTKWMIHEVCVDKNKPLIHGGVLGWQGQVFTFLPQPNTRSVCLNCFFPQPDLKEEITCAEAGVVASLCGVIGSIQATEVIKYFCRPLTSPSYSEEMLQVDLLRGLFRRVSPPFKNCAK